MRSDCRDCRRFYRLFLPFQHLGHITYGTYLFLSIKVHDQSSREFIICNLLSIIIHSIIHNVYAATLYSIMYPKQECVVAVILLVVACISFFCKQGERWKRKRMYSLIYLSGFLSSINVYQTWLFTMYMTLYIYILHSTH